MVFFIRMVILIFRYRYLRRRYREGNFGKKGSWSLCLIFKDRDLDIYKVLYGICLVNIVYCFFLIIYELFCNRKKGVC